jgi:hypothetical protein
VKARTSTNGRQYQPTATSIVGKEGSGKTKMALSWPKPLAIVSLDPNTQYVVDNHDERDQIELYQMRMPAYAFEGRDDVKKEAMELWEAYRSHIRPYVQKKKKAATIVLDTGTSGYDLGVLATFGKSDQIAPEARRNQMGPLNTRWQGITHGVVDAGLNIVIIHRAKNMWVDKVVNVGGVMKEERKMLSGPFDLEREGYKQTGFMVTTEVFVAFDSEREEAERLRDKFGIKIARSQQRPGIIGKEFWGRDEDTRVLVNSYDWLMAQLYPE